MSMISELREQQRAERESQRPKRGSIHYTSICPDAPELPPAPKPTLRERRWEIILAPIRPVAKVALAIVLAPFFLGYCGLRLVFFGLVLTGFLTYLVVVGLIWGLFVAGAVALFGSFVGIVVLFFVYLPAVGLFSVRLTGLATSGLKYAWRKIAL